jgi:FkbM family methyltransferase
MDKPKTIWNEIIEGINYKIKKLFNNPYAKVNINWFYLKYLKHLPGHSLHFHKLFNYNTFFYGGIEYLHGINEIFIEEIYLQVLPENAFIIDCGAHIGLSVIYLKTICPSAKIIAFEPDEENYKLLQKNIESHHLKNITAKKEAVWIENTNLNFIQDGSMASKIGTAVNPHSTSVKAIRLKEYLIEKIDFLKLDIEGAEYKVLKDIQNELHFVKNLFIEYHGSFDQNKELIEILNILNISDFKFYIKEAANIFPSPFTAKPNKGNYDVQLNIFCSRGF